MSEFASAAERARRAFGAVARIEVALSNNPGRRDLQANLAAFQKLAIQSQERLLQLSSHQHVEVCNYRLLPETAKIYALLHVSESLLAYQNLFSQIYDWTKNGPKNRAILGKEAAEESALEFAYSYAGSLGVVLLAPSEREFFTGSLDPSIDRLFQVLNIDSQGSVREISREMGGAVIKRIHDWSRVNIGGGFATDVRWNRSDGRQLGEVIARARMEKIVGIIEATSDESVSVIDETGVLVGGDIGRGSFHFVVPNGPDYRGNFAADFQSDTELTLGRTYQAKIREKRTFLYATEREDIVRELLRLTPPSKANA